MDEDRPVTDAPRVSVIIPVYNEVECLPGLLGELTAALVPAPFAWEVLLVDDGSSDGSAELLDAAARADARFVALHFRRNAGQSAAFAAGFAYARGEIAVTLDADGQNPPAEIPRLVAALTDGIDLVAGYRATRNDSGWRKFQSRFANAVRNRLSGETIRDTGCSLKAFRTRHLKRIPMFNGMHRFLPTLCRLAGAKTVVEIPVAHRPRQGGLSKYGMWNRVFRSLADLMAVRWMQRRWLEWEVR